MSSRRPLGRLLALLLVLVTLAGCAAVLPEPDPDPTPPAAEPVLSVSQVEDVLAAVGEVLAAADAAGDPAILVERVGDPALAMRAAQYTLAERSAGERVPTPLTTDDQVLVVAASSTWPRTVMVVTTPPENTTAPLLLVLVQENARAPYLLRSWVRLFPEAVTPELAVPETGSAEVPADAEGLVASPRDVVARYADVLAYGEASSFFATFGTDPYISQLSDELATAVTALEANGIATVTFSAVPVDGYLAALATVDGGALVVGTITSTTTYTKNVEDATVTLGGALGQWLQVDEVTTSASAIHTSVVAFFVPVGTDGATVDVLGAERVLVDITSP